MLYYVQDDTFFVSFIVSLALLIHNRRFLIQQFQYGIYILPVVGQARYFMLSAQFAAFFHPLQKSMVSISNQMNLFMVRVQSEKSQRIQSLLDILCGKVLQWRI